MSGNVRAPLLIVTMVLLVPILLCVLGIVVVVGALVQSPRDRAAAEFYAQDPSCAAAIDSVPPNGACTTAAATVVAIAGGSNTNANARNQTARLPTVTLALPGGTQARYAFRSDALFHVVYPGDAVRVQLFEGAVTRIGAHGVVADTTSDPADRVASDRALPLVGGAMLAVGAVMLAGLAAIARRMSRAGFSGREGQQ